MQTGQKQPVIVTETDANQNNVPVVPANLQYTMADPTIATVGADANGNVFVSAVAVGATILTVSDLVNNLTGTVSVQVTAGSAPPPVGAPTTLTVTLGPAVAQ